MSNQTASNQTKEKVNQNRVRPIGGFASFEAQYEREEDFGQIPSSSEAYEPIRTTIPSVFLGSLPMGDNIVSGTVKIAEETGKAAVEITGDLFSLIKEDVLGKGAKPEKPSTSEDNAKKQEQTVNFARVREQFSTTEAKKVEITNERLLKDVFRVGGEKVAAMSEDEKNRRLNRQANFKAALGVKDAIDLDQSVRAEEDKIEEIQEQQKTEEVQKPVSGADMLRDGENRNMQQPT